MNKSTPQQIRERFDNDVERFSNLSTGQTAQIDSPLILDLISASAAGTNPNATHILDVGCGAGNYTLKLLQRIPNLNITLIDLSKPMLDRAVQRIRPAITGTITPMQGDIRDLDLPHNQFDIILAAAVLHHLRGEEEWRAVFRKFHAALKPTGSLWISDFVSHQLPQVQKIMWDRYGQYLTNLKDEAYRDHVFAYTEQEDTPRDLMFQFDTLRFAGFQQIELLHKNNCFAAALFALAALTAGILLPFISMSQLGEERIFSLLGGIRELFDRDHLFLGLILLIFSVIFPYAKLIALLIATSRLARLSAHTRHHLHKIAQFTGRYSLLDILVVAIIIVVVKFQDLAEARALPGTYLFALAVFLSIAAGFCVNLESPQATHE